MFRFLLTFFLFFPLLGNALKPQFFYGFDEILNRSVSMQISGDQILSLHELDNNQIVKLDGFSYRYKLPINIEQHLIGNGALSLVLFEDNVLMHQLNCYHGNIENLGLGRTSFCENGYLYFATLDNLPVDNKKLYIALVEMLVEETQKFHEIEIQLHNEVSGDLLQKKYFLPKNNNDRFKIDLEKVERFGNNGYRYQLPKHVNDIIKRDGIYKIALVENNTIFNNVNCFHQNIQDHGMGRVSFFENGYLYFATSDNLPLLERNYYLILDEPIFLNDSILNSTQRYRLQESLRILGDGPLGDARSIAVTQDDRLFYVFEVIGDGDCGFYALNTTRNAVLSYVFENLDNEHIRALLTPEAQAVYADNGINQHVLDELHRTELLTVEQAQDFLAYRYILESEDYIPDNKYLGCEGNDGVGTTGLIDVIALMQKININVWHAHTRNDPAEGVNLHRRIVLNDDYRTVNVVLTGPHFKRLIELGDDFFVKHVALDLEEAFQVEKNWKRVYKRQLRKALAAEEELRHFYPDGVFDD